MKRKFTFGGRKIESPEPVKIAVQIREPKPRSGKRRNVLSGLTPEQVPDYEWRLHRENGQGPGTVPRCFVHPRVVLQSGSGPYDEHMNRVELSRGQRFLFLALCRLALRSLRKGKLCPSPDVAMVHPARMCGHHPTIRCGGVRALAHHARILFSMP